MAWKLRVSEDCAKIKTLKFASERDLRNFDSFVHIYFDETGCGNGYSAYWPLRAIGMDDDKPRKCLPIVLFKKSQLIRFFVEDMIFMILQVRHAQNDPEMLDICEYLEQTRMGIKFDLGYLPPRKWPEVGDMYRIPRSSFGNDPNVLEYKEGRVVENLGLKLRVVPSYLDGDTRRPPKFFEIEKSRVIKINDYISPLRKPYAVAK